MPVDYNLIGQAAAPGVLQQSMGNIMQGAAEMNQLRVQKAQMEDFMQQREEQKEMKHAYAFNEDGSVNYEQTIDNMRKINPLAAAQTQQQFQQQAMQRQQMKDQLMTDMSTEANNIMTRYEQIKSTQGEQAARAVIAPMARQLEQGYRQRATSMGLPMGKPQDETDEQVISGLQDFQMKYKDYAKQQMEGRKLEELKQYRERELGVKEKGIEQRAAAGEATIGKEDLDTMVDRRLAGDTTVLQNIGRGRQGSSNVAAFNKRLGERMREQGITGQELALRDAEQMGSKAGQRALGTRMANVQVAVREADQFADLAQQASDAFPRGEFVPLNKATNYAKSATGDPAYSNFVAANTSFINAYSRAVSPTGVPTVSSQEHARTMINEAMTAKQYKAVIGQLKKEMAAAMKAPKEVKEAYREEAKGSSSHPSDIQDLLKKYGK